MKFNFSKIQEKLTNSTPEILMGLALAGFAGSTIMAVKATPKAIQLIEQEKEIREENNEEEMTKLDIVKVAWKPYIPSLAFYALSATCMFGSNSIVSKRNTALVTAYKLSEKAYSEYKDAVVEQIGEVQEREISERVVEKRMKENPPQGEICVVGNGDVMVYEPLSGRYLKSTTMAIEKAIVDLNYTIIHHMYASVNDLYDKIGLEYTTAGHMLGWNTDNKLDVYYSTMLSDDGTPCLVINYANDPKTDFDKIK